MEMAERLLELRKKANLSQENLAEKLYISRQAVSKWESEQAIPDIENIIKLGELYDVTTDYILTGKPSEVESLPKPTDDKKKPAYGFVWFGLSVLAVTIMYYMTNGF